MKYKSPLYGFHLKYFCLSYLIAGPGKNIKYASEQIALTGTLPTLSLDNIDLSSSTFLRKIITNSEALCHFKQVSKTPQKNPSSLRFEPRFYLLFSSKMRGLTGNTFPSVTYIF